MGVVLVCLQVPLVILAFLNALQAHRHAQNVYEEMREDFYKRWGYYPTREKVGIFGRIKYREDCPVMEEGPPVEKKSLFKRLFKLRTPSTDNT